MHTYLEDRQQITDLLTGWIHRDLGEWEQLRNLFHPDGTIEITWFEGLASDFVDGSMRMGASDARTKHLIGTPVVTFNADATKAIVETNAMIIAENVRLNIGCTTHNRFYDMAEKRNGVWNCSTVRVFTIWAASPSRSVSSISIKKQWRSIRANTPHWLICWIKAASRSTASSQPEAATLKNT